jgi:hypothetical protein
MITIENSVCNDILFGEDYTDEEQKEIISEALSEIVKQRELRR